MRPARLHLVLLCLAALFARVDSARAAEISFTQHYVHNAGELDRPLQFELIDLDRDGDLDVLVAEQFDQEISWVENTGGGVFGAVRSLTALPLGGEVWGVAAGDLDGDGDFDVVGAQGFLLSASEKEVFWFENTATGMNPLAWGAKQNLATGVGGPGTLYVRDLDRDGDNDIVAVLQGDGQVIWFENTDGAGTFAAAAVLASLAGMRGSALFDLDRDGDLDVLAAVDATTDGVYFMENAGSIPFETPVLIAAVADANVLDVADLDRDGWADLVVATDEDADACYRARSLGAGVMMGDPPVLFDTPVLLGALDSPQDIRAGDLDGDGDADIAASSFFGDKVIWYDNEGGSFTERSLDASESRPREIHLGDVDGDGDLDPVVASAVSDDVTWQENRTPHARPGSWYPRDVVVDLSNPPHDFALADFDRDGDVDIAYSRPYDDAIAWSANNGDKSFAGMEQLAVASSPTVLIAGDLDGDADSDLVFAGNGSATAPGWLENPGDGGNWVDHGVVNASAFAVTIALGDLDGDADLDIVAGTPTGGVVWIENRLRDGSNNDFNPVSSSVATGMNEVSALNTADLDSDGDLDLLVTDLGGVGFVYYLNDGLGTFDAGHVLPGTYDESVSILAADFDGDGDRDIAGAARSDGLVLWWENTGGGFAAPQALVSTTDEILALRVIDLDGDGDDDLVFPRTQFGALEWLENLGGSGFAASANLWSSVLEGHFDVGDLDNDGDPDLVLSLHGTYGVGWDENESAPFHLWARKVDVVSTPEQFPALLINFDVTNHGHAGDPDLLVSRLDFLFEITAGEVMEQGAFESLFDRVAVHLSDETGIFIPANNPEIVPPAPIALDGGHWILNALDWGGPPYPPELVIVPGQKREYYFVAWVGDVPSTIDPNTFRVSFSYCDGYEALNLDTGELLPHVCGGVLSTDLRTVIATDVAITTFANMSGTIIEGNAATLIWETDIADSCEISNDVDATVVTVSSFDLASGSELVSPAQDTTYTLTCQGEGGPVSESATVDVDLRPVARDDFYSTPVGTTLNVGIPEGVLANDDDGEAIGPVGVSGADTVSAQGGSVSVGIGGDFTYEPPAWFSGADTFEYQVTDGYSSNTGRVTIQVGEPTPPVATASSSSSSGCTLTPRGEPGLSLCLLLLAMALVAPFRRRRS